MSRIKEWIINFICTEIVIGGHCGLCGSWVSDILVPRFWPYTVCENCRKEAQ